MNVRQAGRVCVKCALFERALYGNVLCMSPCSSLCMIWVPVWVPVWVPLYRYTCLCVLCPVCSVRWDLPCYVSAQCCIGDLGLAITSNDYKEKVNKTNFQVNFLANLSNQSYNSLCFSIFSWNIEFIVNTCHFYTLGSRLGCDISTVYDMICTYIVSLFLHLAVIHMVITWPYISGGNKAVHGPWNSGQFA